MPDTLPQPTFVNPYAEFKSSGEGNRITMDVSRADYLLVKLIRPGSGTITGVMGLLWQKLCNELRDRSITSNTECTAFERFVATSHIVSDEQWHEYQSLKQRLPHGPAGGTGRDAGSEPGGRTEQAARPNVGSRAKGVRRANPRIAEQRGDVPGEGGSTGAGDDAGQGSKAG